MIPHSIMFHYRLLWYSEGIQILPLLSQCYLIFMIIIEI